MLAGHREERERSSLLKVPFDYSLHRILGSLFCSFCFIDDIPLSRPKKKKPRTKAMLGEKLFFVVWNHKFFQDLRHDKHHRSRRDKAPAEPSHCCTEGRIEVSGAVGFLVAVRDVAVGNLRSLQKDS